MVMITICITVGLGLLVAIAYSIAEDFENDY